jgi:hypothetical protein
MASGGFSRLRYALRLVASVFLLSSPCQGAWAQAQAPGRWLPDVAADVAPLVRRRAFAAASHPLR